MRRVDEWGINGFTFLDLILKTNSKLSIYVWYLYTSESVFPHNKSCI